MPGKMTAEHEKLWNEAKKAAAKEGHGGDWAYVQGIFQRMVKGEPKPKSMDHKMPPKTNLANAARRKLAMKRKTGPSMPMEERDEKMGGKMEERREKMGGGY
jgi:hypothetical protein